MSKYKLLIKMLLTVLLIISWVSMHLFDTTNIYIAASSILVLICSIFKLI